MTTPNPIPGGIVTQVPSVGRVVRAAIIADVPASQGPSGDVTLVVLNPTGMFFNHACPQNEDEHRGATRHWPERV